MPDSSHTLTNMKKDKSSKDKSFQETVMWIAEYAYKRANPNGKMNVPSIVFEQVEKDYKDFLMSTPKKDMSGNMSTKSISKVLDVSLSKKEKLLLAREEIKQWERFIKMVEGEE